MNIPNRPFPEGFNLPDGMARRLWTADELERMLFAGILREDDNIELIAGEVVTMAAKGARHEILRNRLVLNWARRLPKNISFAEEPPLRLSAHDEPEPDIVLFPDSMQVTNVRGDTVLLVVEVADTSLSYDLKIKAQLYASFGVREYWVIDTKTLTTTVHREPDGAAYSNVREFKSSDVLTPLEVPELAVRLADLRLE